jgi:hypothetical protein
MSGQRGTRSFHLFISRAQESGQDDRDDDKVTMPLAGTFDEFSLDRCLSHPGPPIGVSTPGVAIRCRPDYLTSPDGSKSRCRARAPRSNIPLILLFAGFVMINNHFLLLRIRSKRKQEKQGSPPPAICCAASAHSILDHLVFVDDSPLLTA